MGLFEGLVSVPGDVRISGVTTGIVRDNFSEEHHGKIKVEYIMGEKGHNVTGWVRVASPYAYRDCGLYMLPEVGSEVVIAFEMGDRNCPIVIGSLWNKENVIPPLTAKERNTVKRLKTKGGCEIIFDDENERETITIQTPNNLHLKLQDDRKMISLQDRDGRNGLVMHTEEGLITLKAEKKIVLEADGKIMLTLDGTTHSIHEEAGKVTVHGTETLHLKGQSASVDGGRLELKGESELKAHSTGFAELKGSVVRIN